MTTGKAIENRDRALLDWLLQAYPGTPRARAKQWILAGRVSVKGVVQRKPHLMLPDPRNELELLGRHAAALACGSGWQIHSQVALVFLDSSLAIVNKAPGLISVPAPNGGLSALSILADFLSGRLKGRMGRAAGKSLPPSFRRLQPLPVHRLDQYTSGVFCMALNPEARRHLIGQVRSHTMQREYVAFVEGRPRTDKGAWRHWMRLSGERMSQQIVPAAEAKAVRSGAGEAATHYEVLAVYPLAGGKGLVTKLRLRLETGLKHQIRLQAASVGLPLIGDRTYHPGYRGEGGSRWLIEFPRQALHSELLTLEHPARPGERMTWRVDLPKDLRELEARLRSGRAGTTG